MLDRQKKEMLRDGLPVEVEPGVYGRLNRENKTLELSNGRVLDVPEKYQSSLLPENKAQQRAIREQESLEQRVQGTPFGEALFKAGEHSNVMQFFKNIGENFVDQPIKALQTQPGQDTLSFLERLGENKAAQMQAYQNVSQRISEESPYNTMLGAAGGIGLDLFATRNLSPAQGAAALSFAGNAQNLIDNPQEVIQDVALSAAGGKLIDKTLGGLSKLANKRRDYRDLKSTIAATEAKNLADEQALNLANAESKALNDQQRQAILSQNTQEKIRTDALNATNRENIAQANLTARQQYQAQKLARDQQIEAQRLQQQTQKAEQAQQMANYRTKLENLPKLQEQSQRQFSANTIQNMEKALNLAGKEASFSSEQIAVNNFIKEFINSTERAATPAGKEATGFLNQIFSKAEGRRITSNELLNAFKAIENRMLKASPEMKTILGDFKDYLAERLPQSIAEAKLFSKQFPRFERELLKEFDRGANLLKIPGNSAKNTKENLKQILKELTPETFHELSKSGNLKNYISDLLRGKTSETVVVGDKKLPVTKYTTEAQKQIADFLETRANKVFQDSQAAALENAVDIQRNLGNKLKNTTGFSPPLEAPSPPEMMAAASNMGAPIPPPISTPIPTPFVPQAPNLQVMPPKFTPQPFNPAPIPTISPPQGIGDSVARGLEDLNAGNLLKSKSLTDNPLAKLAALKYVLGSAAAPIELATAGGIGAMKALTSPSAVGDISRQSFKQGMLGLIDSLARRYPSYRNGILDNPADRRSLTKEIEENPSMSLEDKAIYQSKINRGEPLQ